MIMIKLGDIDGSGLSRARSDNTSSCNTHTEGQPIGISIVVSLHVLCSVIRGFSRSVAAALFSVISPAVSS